MRILNRQFNHRNALTIPGVCVCVSYSRPSSCLKNEPEKIVKIKSTLKGEGLGTRLISHVDLITDVKSSLSPQPITYVVDQVVGSKSWMAEQT